MLFGNIRGSDEVLECYRCALAIKIKIEHQIITLVVLVSSRLNNIGNTQYQVEIVEQNNRIQLHASSYIHDKANPC